MVKLSDDRKGQRWLLGNKSSVTLERKGSGEAVLGFRLEGVAERRVGRMWRQQAWATCIRNLGVKKRAVHGSWRECQHQDAYASLKVKSQRRWKRVEQAPCPGRKGIENTGSFFSLGEKDQFLLGWREGEQGFRDR